MSSIHVFFFFILGTLASLVMSRTIHETVIVEKHEQWMVDHGRNYGSDLEKEKRLNIFKDNLEYIERFNNGGNRTYKLGLNEFADMTQDEFIATHTGYKMPDNPTMTGLTSFMYEKFSDVPTSIDWRDQGAVTSVKNQQQCGCCWAFSAVGAMEGIIKIKTGKLMSLSEQQLVDCTDGNKGCQGGWMMTAFEYVVQNQGIVAEESYPYQASQGTCDTQDQINKVATIDGYQQVPENDEDALLKAVANQPVSVTLDASGRDFMYYDGTGVFTGGECSTAPTHAVTIVGYGRSEEAGLDYWVIKNSWGETWGENGYMKIQRGANTCGIAFKPSYPFIGSGI